MVLTISSLNNKHTQIFRILTSFWFKMKICRGTKRIITSNSLFYWIICPSPIKGARWIFGWAEGITIHFPIFPENFA